MAGKARRRAPSRTTVCLTWLLGLSFPTLWVILLVMLYGHVDSLALLHGHLDIIKHLERRRRQSAQAGTEPEPPNLRGVEPLRAATVAEKGKPTDPKPDEVVRAETPSDSKPDEVAQATREAPASAGVSDVAPKAGGNAFQDNSERRPPEPGDADLVSERGAVVLPGFSATRMHGHLGFDKEGRPLYTTTPLPPQPSPDFMKESHRGFRFHSAMSESLPLDYDREDQRSPECRALHDNKYPHKDLPTASVIMVFHNENLSVLLRGLHSVLNLTPPRLLKEIFLVDDGSTRDPDGPDERHFLQLQDQLEEYCRNLPKVTLLRLKNWRGLMRARMEGAWRSTGEALIFLDSHIECTKGWAEPLLARIREDPRHVVVPCIDGIDSIDWRYKPYGGLGVMGFTWSLGQAPGESGMGRADPMESSIMAGGLFAQDRMFFLHLGGYDSGMRIYGGEEMEIGFRTWQCGGTIELLPCSHVGHMFRNNLHWNKAAYHVPGEDISRNKLRTAEVWMDSYKPLVHLNHKLPESWSLGDIEPRKKLRETLQCKSFQWYLDNVARDMHAPPLGPGHHAGALKNVALGACLDSLGAKNHGQDYGAYSCHGQGGSVSPAGQRRELDVWISQLYNLLRFP